MTQPDTAAGYRIGMEDGCIEHHTFQPPCELAPEPTTTAATEVDDVGWFDACDCPDCKPVTTETAPATRCSTTAAEVGTAHHGPARPSTTSCA